MDSTLISVGLVLLFVLVGGFFAGSEIALISLRDSQVRGLSERGGRGATVARLRGDPNRFLSSVQVGVTLTGFFASSYGGATIAVALAPRLEAAGLSAGLASTLALIAVTIVVSYLSLVLGELVPKRLALQRSTGWSLIAAPVLDRVAVLTRPVIWVLGVSTDAVGRLIGLRSDAGGSEVSEEELRDIVAGHEDLDDDERRVLGDVFAAADLRLSSVMIPRTEVAFLPAAMSLDEAADRVGDEPHSRYPVIGETADDVLGFVHVRDVFTASRRAGASGTAGSVGDILREVAQLPGTLAVLPALNRMRRDGRHLAVVVDEYGGTDGIVTLEDLIEELVGEIEDEYDAVGAERPAPPAGSVDLDGLSHRDEVREATGLTLPEGPFDTLAGFVQTTLGRVPLAGDRIEALGHRWAVTEVDGRRTATVRVTPIDQP